MKQLIVATGNRDKFVEISSALRRHGISPVMRNVDFRERGRTLDAIVRSKARQAWRRLCKPLIVDDTGVFFTAYRNYPGIRARRVFERIGYDGLMRKLAGRSRGAYFKTLICYTDGRVTKTFSGVFRGTITRSVHDGGRRQLPYDNIFVPLGSSKPMARLPLSRIVQISHRATAVRKFAQWYRRHEV